MRIDNLHSRLEYMTMLAKDKATPTMSLSTQAKTAEVCPFSFLGFRTLGIGQFKILLPPKVRVHPRLASGGWYFNLGPTHH